MCSFVAQSLRTKTEEAGCMQMPSLLCSVTEGGLGKYLRSSSHDCLLVVKDSQSKLLAACNIVIISNCSAVVHFTAEGANMKKLYILCVCSGTSFVN